MSRPIITLTTDFGEGSPYVAEMKAAILRVNRDVHLIDVSHSIAAQNIRQAALVLETTAFQFPAATIHVVVVDPGVGSQRAILCAEFDNQYFIAPDNGLVSLVCQASSRRHVVALDRPRFWQTPLAATFHGRDIMAPVAAHLSLGVLPSQLGSEHADLVNLDWPEPELGMAQIRGEIVAIDSFGNVATNIKRIMLPPGAFADTFRLTCKDHVFDRWVNCYADVQPGERLVLVGSSGRVELAVCRGNAAAEFGIGVGDPVIMQWVTV